MSLNKQIYHPCCLEIVTPVRGISMSINGGNKLSTSASASASKLINSIGWTSSVRLKISSKYCKFVFKFVSSNSTIDNRWFVSFFSRSACALSMMLLKIVIDLQVLPVLFRCTVYSLAICNKYGLIGSKFHWQILIAS